MKWCKENGIKVYASSPALRHDKNITNVEQKFLSDIENYYKKENIEYLGNPQDDFYEVDDIFNTEYHLNKQGQKKRTKHLIKLLKKLLSKK